MKTDIRSKTGIIIKRDGEYLVGTILYSTQLRWSRSPYDAWITRSREAAERVAGKVRGRMVLFNPIVGKTKEMKGR